MKRGIVILFLGLIFGLTTAVSYSKYRKNTFAHQEGHELEHFANELESKLLVP